MFLFLINSCRSGTFSSSSTQKRRIKSMGSNKIDGYCPSSIEILVKEDEVAITFWKTHFGHTLDLQHLTFSEQEKANLAGMLTVAKILFHLIYT